MTSRRCEIVENYFKRFRELLKLQKEVSELQRILNKEKYLHPFLVEMEKSLLEGKDKEVKVREKDLRAARILAKPPVQVPKLPPHIPNPSRYSPRVVVSKDQRKRATTLLNSTPSIKRRKRELTKEEGKVSKKERKKMNLFLQNFFPPPIPRVVQVSLSKKIMEFLY